MTEKSYQLLEKLVHEITGTYTSRDFGTSILDYYSRILNFERIHFGGLDADGNGTFRESVGYPEFELHYGKYKEHDPFIPKNRPYPVGSAKIIPFSFEHKKMAHLYRNNKLVHHLCNIHKHNGIYLAANPENLTVITGTRIESKCLSEENREFDIKTAPLLLKYYGLYLLTLYNEDLSEYARSHFYELGSGNFQLFDFQGNPVTDPAKFYELIAKAGVSIPFIKQKISEIRSTLSSNISIFGKDICICEIADDEHVVMLNLQPLSIGGISFFQVSVINSASGELTSREMDIVSSIKAGFSNIEISKKFNISEQTVKKHISNIFKKTGTRNRTELALRSVFK